MAPKLNQGARMTIRYLKTRGLPQSGIARLLGVSEGAVRYHLRRVGIPDGRSQQLHLAAGFREAITLWLESLGAGPVNLAALHAYLVEEHGYTGSLRSIERYFRACFPRPKQRARRRVETPAGAQSQVDWAEYRGMLIGSRPQTLYAFHMQLSFSRREAIVWSPRKDQLSWHHVHNEAFRRLEGVAATARVDNEKTAMSRGAGAWGEINPSYRRYAHAVRFHVDPPVPT